VISLKAKAIELRRQVRELENTHDIKEKRALPSNCWFLDENMILAHKRKLGDGRYPYANDGLTLWAYSSGNISVQESLFNIFLDSREGKEPYIGFFVGKKEADSTFSSLSLLGPGRQPMEKDVNRYTVFTPQAAYYFMETKEFFAVVRTFVDEQKRICFSTYFENISGREQESYLCAYFNPFLRHTEGEGFEDKWYKSCAVTEYGFDFKVTEYISRESCLTHYASLLVNDFGNMQKTTSRFEFTGGMNESLNCSTSLRTGEFEKCKSYTEFTDMAIAGCIKPLCLQAGEGVREDYILVVSDDKDSLNKKLQGCARPATLLDAEIEKAEQASKNGEANQLNIRFSGLTEALSDKDEVFNYFLRNVIRQTEFCARAKNYAGPFIGIRDVFQQVEAALAWVPQYCRGKIIEALNFIGDNGRAPRQYSYPANSWTAPKMDLRAFIDQGVWIISTVYTYLCYTDDYSILNETCGYYHFEGHEVKLCNKRDSVLQHLLAITDYLVSNLDADTGCLKALYGDWNDALDGLGKTKKEGLEFGNGVSVMASLQLYRNLAEMSDILCKIGGYSHKVDEYAKIRNDLELNLIKYAIVTNEEGERKILHGWGEDRSWFVGSYCDNDGCNRDGLTASAYWILSGLYKADSDIIPDILKAYGRLDSKYGLKTFEPYFSSENEKVGRINRLPKGTAENGATYIHATLFGVWSLFEIGEAKRAWEQIYKILPITHEFISTTPFVMPNSYVFNEERGFDGESMSDWCTGSGCVLLKVLFGGIFGVQPTLDGVKIKMNAYMPATNAEIHLRVKGCKISLQYRQENTSERKYIVNKKQAAQDSNGGIFLSAEELRNGDIAIEIID